MMYTTNVTWEWKYHETADGQGCVLIRQPNRPTPMHCVSLVNITLAATKGCGHHAPGVIVCGYTETTPGWVVGHMDVISLLQIIVSIEMDLSGMSGMSGMNGGKGG